ncbi:hypothetical protein IX51_01720 [uncultured archaeon]|nr:hypothetical protein IX51_01720 [uncultured archaeon]
MIDFLGLEVSGFLLSLLAAYVIGIVHGITPDEHTWPITFSYAIGNYSSRKGAKAGFIFSSGFTLQSAFVSELAFFALASFLFTNESLGIVYIIVGSVMTVSGLYIMKKLKYPHFHFIEEKLGYLFGVHRKGSPDQKLEFEHRINPLESTDASPYYRKVPNRLAFVHGLIAGFGMGVFSIFIYVFIAPSMPSPYVAFLPGALFGLGTMTMQIILGSGFGRWLSSVKGLSRQGIEFVARGMSSSVLSYGGLAFVSGGALVLAYPQINNYSIVTPLGIPNLHELGLGFFLVIGSVAIIGILSYFVNVRKAQKLGLGSEAET